VWAGAAITGAALACTSIDFGRRTGLYLDRLARVFDRRQRRNLVGAALGPPADIANIHAAFMDKRA
jgi:hypothetical protein